jgi:gas vesicle protein GvpK
VSSFDRVLEAHGDLDGLAGALGGRGSLPRRIDADPERVERGLAQLVLTLVELLRQLMERQAARESLFPLAEDAAGAAGRYVAEHGPDFLSERLVPRFITAFNNAKG